MLICFTSQIQSSKEGSIKSRKLLAEQTKQFRKLTNEEKLKKFPSLLKTYQEEVDKLTKRAKFSDGAFLSLYKSMYEAPDPAAAINAALDEANTSKPQIAALELANAKLKAELSENDKEFSTLKNQDVTIRKLEDELEELKSSMEERVKALAEEEAAKAADGFVAERKLYEGQQLKKAEEVHKAQQALADSQRAQDDLQSKLFDLRTKLVSHWCYYTQQVPLQHTMAYKCYLNFCWTRTRASRPETPSSSSSPR